MTSVQSEVKEAVERVSGFLAEWEASPSRDDTVYGLHSGHDREQELTTEDLRTLLAALSSQAEVMEAMASALSDHDAKVDECRIDGSRPQKNTSLPCDRCGATSRESCGAKLSAAHSFITEARNTLSACRSLNGDA